ncbi:putative dehydrogenase [Crossiella equi]|uniref:Dehydrogenase n=1 Tax=Crossiella equi TaxID=130796 RepID=A0ABS5A5P5_9PSEU|nr:Gfo/Idh/MocA family oxidoreductase [Crossiella equi]MBP2471914.1 putative dehydrogenase [Crossiella equi]
MTAVPVNTLLVGYGYWGTRFVHIAGRVPALRIVGVVDSRAGTEGFTPPPGLPCERDLARAVADPAVRAVIITTPATEHLAPAREALRAGKHVFTEKPFAMTAKETGELLDLAREHDLMLTVDHQYWWSTEIDALERALLEGVIGRVGAVSVVRAGDGPVREDVGALWDLGAHDLSILVRLGLLNPDGGACLRVAECHETPDGPVAGCVALTGHTPESVALRLHVCWVSARKQRALVISGELGSLRLEESDRYLAVWLVRGGRRRLLSRTAKSGRGTPIERALAEFAEGALGRPDLSKAVEAGRVVAVLEQIEDSARAVTSVVGARRCWL